METIMLRYRNRSSRLTEGWWMTIRVSNIHSGDGAELELLGKSGVLCLSLGAYTN